MPFLSYAQNYEDVILWRVLCNVENGFYVDVGAADPIEHSVTRAFYERGWSGINIEPTEEYYARLVADRPRDLNLRVLAGAKPGIGTIHVIPGTGLSTTNGDFAALHAKKGRPSISEKLPIVPLNGILHEHSKRPIHFLKIDVEGAERSVLEGLDLKQIRPWIVLVEATEPETQIRTDHFWADLLLDQDYTFALFDGLNCFYIANEHAAFKEILALPPNDFDNFRRISEHVQFERLERASNDAQTLQADRDRLAQQVAALETSCAEAIMARDTALAETLRLKHELEETATQKATLSIALTDARVSRIHMAGQLAQIRGLLHQSRQDLSSRDATLSQLHDQAAILIHSLAHTTALQIQLREHSNVLEQRLKENTLHLQQIFSSSSWRITGPVRKAVSLARSLRGRPTHDAQAHFDRSPVLSLTPMADQPLTAPNALEAKLRSTALPDSAGAILARLEALAHNDPSGA